MRTCRQGLFPGWQIYFLAVHMFTSAALAKGHTGCTRLRPRFGVAGVAMDRFTGQVLDKQIEVVNE